jgi:hypothetical protein
MGLFHESLSLAYSVVPHGPDDRADAAVLAISELARKSGEQRNQIYSMVGGRSVPDYQEESLRAIYGNQIPDYAIDKVPKSHQRRSQSVSMRRSGR